MPAHVHLEEPLLGVHVALGAHQVGERVGVELRDAVVVADHLDLAVRPGRPRARRRSAGTAGGPATTAGRPTPRPGPARRTTATYDAQRAGRGQPRNGLPPRRSGLGESRCDVMVGHGVHCAVPLAVGRGECQHPRPFETEGEPVPTYQYACTECAHAFEQFQSFTDDALTECPECDGRLRKVFNAVGVVFKGSGFYRTDSRGSEASANGAKAESSGSEESGRSPDKSDHQDRDSKPEKSSTRPTRRLEHARPPRPPRASLVASRTAASARPRPRPCGEAARAPAAGSTYRRGMPTSRRDRLARRSARPYAARCCRAAGCWPRCSPRSRCWPGSASRAPRRPDRRPVLAAARDLPAGAGAGAPTTCARWRSPPGPAPAGLADDAGRPGAGRAAARGRAGHRRPPGRRAARRRRTPTWSPSRCGCPTPAWSALLRVGDRDRPGRRRPAGRAARGRRGRTCPCWRCPAADDDPSGGLPGRLVVLGRPRDGPHGAGRGGRLAVPDLRLLALACGLTVRLGRSRARPQGAP